METAPPLDEVTPRVSARRWLAHVLGAWAAVAVLHLFAVRLANLWLLATAIFAVAWLGAVTLTLVAPFRLRGAGIGRALAVPVAGLVAAGVIVVTPWTRVYAEAGYALNREAFADVVQRAENGEFDDTEYYGDPLPGRMRLISRGTVVRFSGSALFVPVYSGIPDGGAGFGYLGDGGAGPFDCFGDPCDARWDLGGGWWWVSP